MLRTIFIIIFLFLFFTIGQISLLIGFVINIFNKELCLKFYRSVVKFVLNVIFILSGYKLEIKNKSNIEYVNRLNEPILFISNHRSIFDLIVSYIIIDKPICFIAKIELSKIPLFSLWMKNIGCLFLDRNDIRQGMQVVLNAIEQIKSGNSVFICPEGTRNKSDDACDLLEFKEGSFSIAKKTDCRIVPIAFLYEKEVFEKTFPFIKNNTIYFNIDTGYYTKDNKSELNISQYSYKIVKNMLKQC